MRGRTGIACLIALAVTATGCGGGPEKPESPASAGLSRTAGGQKLSPVNLPDAARQLGDLMREQTKTTQTVRISATTEAEGDSGKSSIQITGALLKPSGKQVTASLKVVEVGGAEPGTTYVMVGNGAVFTKVEGETFDLGKPWLQVSTQDLSNPNLGPDVKEAYQDALGVAASAVQQTSTDMGVSVLTFGRLTRPPEWEKLAGSDVKRYTGTTEVGKLAEATNDPNLRQMIAGGFRQYPWTMWVDKFGLPRQFTSTMSLPKAGTITTRANYAAWGQPLTITFPPASDVATLRG